MKKRVKYPSCDFPEATNPKKQTNRNRVYRNKGNYRWQGIKVECYKPEGDDWAEIIRQVLIGSHGESTGFHLRYFEVAPGGHSSYETHRHEHVVIGIRGRGKVRIGRRDVEIGFLDTLYIAPGTPHRLFNPFEEPFGFFCIVNAERDRPRQVEG